MLIHDFSLFIKAGKPKLAYRMYAVRPHALPIFPIISTHRVRALRHTPYLWVQRPSEKTLAAFVPSALR
ncbi:hypothetical protein ACTHTQ_03320 [Neisseria sp. P0020.S003]|uniref:hypothetical protein n=1 Tax=Neisseria sp. P0020.S003 TaxID=3436808 RepID=UPI003F7F6B75